MKTAMIKQRIILDAQSDSRIDVIQNNLQPGEVYDNFLGHLALRIDAAMDTYAEQEATGFTEWVSESGYVPSTFFKSKWNKGNSTVTTSALYAEYKKEVWNGI